MKLVSLHVHFSSYFYSIIICVWLTTKCVYVYECFSMSYLSKIFYCVEHFFMCTLILLRCLKENTPILEELVTLRQKV